MSDTIVGTKIVEYSNKRQFRYTFRHRPTVTDFVVTFFDYPKEVITDPIYDNPVDEIDELCSFDTYLNILKCPFIIIQNFFKNAFNFF